MCLQKNIIYKEFIYIIGWFIMLEINIVGEIVTMSDDCSRNDSPVQVTESYDLYGMLAGSNSQKNITRSIFCVEKFALVIWNHDQILALIIFTIGQMVRSWTESWLDSWSNSQSDLWSYLWLDDWIHDQNHDQKPWSESWSDSKLDSKLDTWSGYMIRFIIRLIIGYMIRLMVSFDLIDD